jgi:hypothetical protein
MLEPAFSQSWPHGRDSIVIETFGRFRWPQPVLEGLRMNSYNPRIIEVAQVRNGRARLVSGCSRDAGNPVHIGGANLDHTNFIQS